MEFSILHDPRERVVGAFQTIGVPESLLIGRNGVLLHRWCGPLDPLADENRRRVTEAFASTGP